MQEVADPLHLLPAGTRRRQRLAGKLGDSRAGIDDYLIGAGQHLPRAVENRSGLLHHYADLAGYLDRPVDHRPQALQSVRSPVHHRAQAFEHRRGLVDDRS